MWCNQIFTLHKRIDALGEHWGFCAREMSAVVSSKKNQYAEILTFSLHQRDKDASLFVRERAAVVPYLVILEYRQPERNLDFPAFWLFGLLERLGTHGAQYRAFLQRGGIEAVLRDAGLVPLHREPIRGGAASLIVCRGLVE